MKLEEYEHEIGRLIRSAIDEMSAAENFAAKARGYAEDAESAVDDAGGFLRKIVDFMNDNSPDCSTYVGSDDVDSLMADIATVLSRFFASLNGGE